MNDDQPLYLDARLHLLERQVEDDEDRPAGVVDDLELLVGIEGESVNPNESEVPAGSAHVTALLGGESLLTRLFGGFLPYHRRHRVDWRDVRSLGLAISLNVPSDELDQTFGERWTREHVIGRIPGAHH